MKQEKQEAPSFFKEMGSFMKPDAGLYGTSIFLSILAVAANLGSYAFVGFLAAGLFSGGLSHAWALAGGAVLCKLLYALLLNASTWCSHKAAYHTLRDIRKAMAKKMLRLPMGYFEQNGSGRLKVLLTDQVEAIEKPLAHVLPEMTANLLVPFALMVWMFFLDWRLALCAFIWICLGLSVTGGMMKNYPEKFAGQLKASKTMNQAVTEYVGGIEVIKNFGQADDRCKKYEEAVYGHADYNVNWQRETLKYSALGMAVAPFSVFPVLILGLILFSHGTLEAPTLFLCVLLTLGIFGPLMSTMNYYDQLAQMGTTAQELKNILEHPELKSGSGAEAENGDVEFSHVGFSYTEGDSPTLEDITFRVPTGTMLALVGPSGSGKSTIAKLLGGFWDAQSGEIFLGGHKVSDYTPEQRSKLLAYVDQDTFLFNETIADNIRLGVPDATDEEVRMAAKKAGCDDFIQKLPQGYDTMAGTAGDQLSGGEKQRIAIARAMLKNAPVMVLDEATASADPENEALIQSALSAAAAGKTLIVVAHHLSTIQNAQQIAYVAQGRIEKIGTHAELLRDFPKYAALWKLSREG